MLKSNQKAFSFAKGQVGTVFVTFLSLMFIGSGFSLFQIVIVGVSTVNAFMKMIDVNNRLSLKRIQTLRKSNIFNTSVQIDVCLNSFRWFLLLSIQNLRNGLHTY